MLAVVAEGPGTEVTLKLLLSHSLIKSEPGSEMSGVPESDIRAIENPLLNFVIILGIIFLVLNLWKEISFVLIPYLIANLLKAFLSSGAETFLSTPRIS